MIASRRTYARSCLLVCAAALLLAPVASAQSITGGTLEGVVRGTDGEPVMDARVMVAHRETGAARTAVTSDQGRFRIGFLPPGEYDISVEQLGYRPRRILGVPISAGQSLSLEIRIEAAPPPIEEVDVGTMDLGALTGSAAGATQRFSRFELSALPDASRELTDLARLATKSNEALETEGLPASLTRLVIDGLPFTAATHPDIATGHGRGAVLPLSAAEHVELITAEPDVEWSGFGGGILAARSRRGTRDLQVRTFGAWSGDALWSSRFVDGGAPSHNAYRGGFQVGGPLIRDTAYFAIGLEAWRAETPLPRPWELDGSQLLQVAESFGVDVREYQRPRLVRTEAFSAFGRFDWRIARDHTLEVRGSVASLPASPVDLGPARSASLGASVEGQDASASATLTSQLSARFAQELRLGFEKSRRAYSVGDDSGDEDLPATRVVAGGFGFGTDPGLPGEFEHTGVHLTQSVHFGAGRGHRIKVGLAGSFDSYDNTYAYGRSGQFLFGGIDEFSRREGAFVQAVGPVPIARFDVRQYAVFAQDLWNVFPGFDLLFGVRFELEELPRDQIRLNRDWLDLTGIANNNITSPTRKLSPRLGFQWDVQGQHQWLLRGSAGIFFDRTDPGVLTELLTHDGRVRIRRGVGDLSAWPNVPDSAHAPVVAPRLTLLGPEFTAPRTARASLGLTRSLGPGASFHLSTTFRQTDFLPRRSNVNLLPTPSAQDQYGRPIYGTLVQQGELLVAQPGTGRRFTDFEMVSAMNADGTSRYADFTVALERRPPEGIGFFARYTFSRTTDNWLGARGAGPEAELTPFPEGLDGTDWAEGRSDLDIPHRLAAGAEVAVGPVRIAGVYRYRSGTPFTPGFREGVDANGDGSGLNDPAFVDDAIPGIDELIARWDCLRDQVGRFAERNACRAPGVHTIDARIAVSMLRLGSYRAEIVLDALNVLDSDIADPDAALYLVDSSRSLTVNQATGVVEVPLVANPHFGEPLVRRTPGRMLRLGIRVNY